MGQLADASSVVGTAVAQVDGWRHALGSYGTLALAAVALVVVVVFVRKLVRLGRRTAATALGVGSLGTGAPAWAALRSWLHTKGWV